jgi:Bacterial Ig-like domain (group 1)
MSKFLSWMMAAAAALVLAGCGGSGNGPLTGSSTPPGGTTTGPTVHSMAMTTSLPQLASDGSQTATINALVLDAQNNVMVGIPVTFQATSGALTVASGTTNTNGMATATLTPGGDPSDRTITVTATAGTITGTITVDVVGTKLTLSGPTSLVLNATGSYSATLENSAGNGISGQTVTITSTKDNTLTPGTFVTDASGEGTFKVTAVNSGTDTITAAAGGLKAAQNLSVSSDDFTFSTPAANANITIGTTATIKVNWQNSGQPVADGTTVSFAATRGTLSASSATTTGGSATVTISSTTAGPAVISATGSGGVSAEVTVNFIATTPATLNLQPSPATIPTQSQSTLTATVRDANQNLVEGKTVNFSITADPTGGSLSVASAVTNYQGQASTVYSSTGTTSQLNGVQIDASIPGTSVSGSTSLTVAGETVFLSLGTGNTIKAYSSTQYEMPYTVQAVDAAGNPVKGVTVTFTVNSVGYIKGCELWDAGAGTGTCAFPNTPPSSGTGAWAVVWQTPTDTADTYTLDGITGCKANAGVAGVPGEAVSTDVTSGVTGADGTAPVNLIYPKSVAWYVAATLTATATVQGTENSTKTTIWLPILAADVSAPNVAPPGPFSPYGIDNTCADTN